jgi:hypothetical protein
METLIEKSFLRDLVIEDGIILKHVLQEYEGVSKIFRNGRLERELQMVQLPLGAVVSLFCESV